ncbi:FtsX-like permease family protein [Haloimpatiens massiliensis]|uniref:FtsX-like permease family protein n=1 Tax=Haloimpatiens massiliensis TaxID=1658110 RepID=UPI000C81FE91|nr:FtsX-like permease family protein [Haloimpatiens massiliensis]
MKKTFLKNLFRDIKNTFSRFLSIVVIIAVGVSFYAGVRATSPDMKMSGDYYFNKNNFMDFKIISTLGLTEDDLSDIKKQRGVKKAEGSYSIDAVIEKNKQLLVLNINSLPREDGINNIRIISGRTPKSNNEAIVEERFLKENKLKLNDKIILKSGNDSKLEDSLNNTEFKIVGTAKSPLYVSAQRQLSSVGNGSVRGFVYVLPEVFKSEIYTEIYVRSDSEQSRESLLNNESYNNANKGIEKALKDIGVVRNKIRYEDVIKSSKDKIKEAENKLYSSKKEAQDKFVEGYKKLDAAREKIAKGKDELKENEIIYNQKMLDGEKRIEEGKSKIKSAENEIKLKSEEIKNGKLRIAEGKKNLDNSEKELNLGKKEAAERISSEISRNLSDLKAKLDADPTNHIYIQQHNSLNYVYENNIKGKDFDSMYSSLKNDNMLDIINNYFHIESVKSNFDKAALEISAGRMKIAQEEKLLIQGENQLNAGIAELQISKKKISDSQIELDKGRQEGLEKLNEGRRELEDGEKQLNSNLQKLKEEEKSANNKFKEAEAEIEKNKKKLKELKDPDWYVLGRSTNVGYETYRQDSNRIDNIGKAFPLIFFLVAALVSLTTMTRMVQEKRIEIGTFKALGYSRASIVAHYLIYALSASLIGSLIGILIGFRLFPPLIIDAYSSIYAIPDSVTPFNTGIALQAAILAVLFTATAAVAATLEELREVPASLMRPKPPKSGKEILLERITFIWRRLSFTKKVTARNIFRYKQRFFMTVIGIAACTGLMITGFGIKGGIIGATERQFGEIYKYHMQGTLTKNIDDSEKNSIKEKITNKDNVKSVLFTYSKNATTKKEDSKNEDIYVVVPEDKDKFNDYINLTMDGKALNINDEGVVLTEKLSRLTNKKVGDNIVINLNDKDIEVKIAGITEQYIQHYVYMSPEYYKKIIGDRVDFNSFYGLLKDTSHASENNLAKDLKGIKDINSVGFKNNIYVDYNKSMESVNTVVLILIVSAGVLAFVVIYNLTNININERRRELATIKLLGFYNNELANYIYRENIILTIIGSLTGIFMGIFLHRFIIVTAETNIIMFLRKISPIYFLYSILLTMVFSIVVNLAMYKRFDKIDMIDSLKSAE